VKFARRLADRAYIIEKGEIKFEGAIADLDRDEALRRAYLGV
jgi:branched-chain amino acid transport system ATP-binding protein